MQRLTQELKCVSDMTSKPVLSMQKDLPKSITDRDFNKDQYVFQGFMELKYPQDYEALKDKASPELFMKQIQVSANSKFTLDTSIKFDYPYSLFSINLFDNLKSDTEYSNNPDDYEDVVQQLPVQVDQGDVFTPTLVRSLRANDLRKNNVLYLTFADEISQSILDYAYSLNKQPLCLYTELSLILTKESQPTLSSLIVPTITFISPAMTSDRDIPFTLDRTTNELAVSVELNTPPFYAKTEIQQDQQIASNAEIADMFTLQFYNPATKDLLYQKRPIRIGIDKSQYKSLQMIYSLTEELKNPDATYLMKFNIDLENLVDRKKNSFNLKPGVFWPRFVIDASTDHENKIIKEEDVISRIDQLKRNQTNKTDGKQPKEKVKCLCVHGVCRDGESQCSKCDKGWTGKMCDIKIDATNINRQDDKKPVNPGRMQRQRDQQNDDEIETLKKIEQSSRKQQYITKQTDNKVILSEQKSDGFLDTIEKAIYDVSIIILVLVAIIAIAYLIMNRGKINPYIPVPMNEEEHSPQRAMELTDFRSSKRRNKPNNQGFPQNLSAQRLKSDQHLEDETRKLTQELELFSSEQDPPQQDLEQDHQYSSPEQQHTEPQHVNEVATSHEIANVLKSMKDFDDDEDDEEELRRFV